MRGHERIVRLAVGAAVLALCVGGGMARADESGPVVAGKGIAQICCVNCHAVAPTQARGSAQTPSFAAIAERPDTTAQKLHNFLAQPHGMPDFRLGGKDIDNVVAYILSLKP